MENFVERISPCSEGCKTIIELYARSGSEKSPLFPLLNHIALIGGGFAADERTLRESGVHALKFIYDNIPYAVMSPKLPYGNYNCQILSVHPKLINDEAVITMPCGIGVHLPETGIAYLNQPITLIDNNAIAPWNRILLTIKNLISDKFVEFIGEYERRVNEIPPLQRMARLLKESCMCSGVNKKPFYEAIGNLITQSGNNDCILSVDRFTGDDRLHIDNICYYNSRNSMVTLISNGSIRTFSLMHHNDDLDLALTMTKAIETTRERLTEEYKMAFDPVHKCIREIKKQRERLLSMF